MTHTAKEFIEKVHEVAAALAFQAGVGGVETAGFIISCLYTQPDQIDRFMAEGAELILDGTIRAENGALSYYGSDGQVHFPSELRARRGMIQ